MKHLSDEQIQSLLDGEEEDRTAKLQHLETCARCRTHYREYQQLYGALAESDGFSLSADFSDAVLRRVAPRQSRIEWVEDSVIFAATAAVVVAVLYLTGFSFAAGFLRQSAQVLASGLEWLSSPGSGHYWLAAAVILIFGNLDRLIRTLHNRGTGPA